MDQQAQLRERVVAMKRKHEDEKAEEFPAKKQKPVVALRELSPSPLTTTGTKAFVFFPQRSFLSVHSW